MNHPFFENPWVWLVVAVAAFALCTFLPIWIKNDTLRRLIMWLILIPVSLLIILYVYPQGLEVFRRLAIGE